jgi:predicted ATPase
MTLHLKSISIRQFDGEISAHFPFTLPVLRSLQEILFDSPVTFLVGENGSGKSTILEAIACAIGSTTVGAESVKTDKTLIQARQLAKYFKLSWGRRTHRGFFLRAEDFFGYVKQLAQTREELESDLAAVDKDYEGRSMLAISLARSPYLRELHGLQEKYGSGLDCRSHGESFMALFQSRFVPDGLYLLDEPEAPLSPVRQLAFISELKRMVEEKSQFIIATHSPIIMAFPGAMILSFDYGDVTKVAYEDLEHVTLMKSFLNNPESFLRRL